MPSERSFNYSGVEKQIKDIIYVLSGHFWSRLPDISGFYMAAPWMKPKMSVKLYL